jgi:hypothetical protein
MSRTSMSRTPMSRTSITTLAAIAALGAIALEPVDTFACGVPFAAFKAIAVSWNVNGQWVAQKSPTLEIAGATAMSQCNGQHGQCVLSGATVSPTRFACLAVARSNEDPTRLFAAIGASIDQGRAAVGDQLTSAGMTGRLEYVDCNG